MDETARTEGAAALAQAQAIIARQSLEIERLQRRLEDERFAQDLSGTLTLAASAATIHAPVRHSRLLEMIVATAAHIISARAASLFLIDRAANELVFEVVFGGSGEAVKKYRLPLGHGIAGLVAVTGQAMAMSNADQDPRQATDIAQRVNYVPQNILCVPLFLDDEIIGVIELLDKANASYFDASDMERLGLFANQAAVAIEYSRNHENLVALIGDGLESLGVPDAQRGLLEPRAAKFGEGLQQRAEYQRALELARLVQEIASQGEDQVKACQAILGGFAAYLRSHRASESGGG